MGSLSRGLVIGPLIILAVIVVLNGAAGLTSAGTVSPFCSGGNNALSCNTAPGATTFSCNVTSFGAVPSCVLPYQCPNPVPAPTFCTSAIVTGVAQWRLPTGDAITIANSVLATLAPTVSTPTTNVGFQLFGNSTDFIIILSASIFIAVALGVSLFGSSVTNTEGTHIGWLLGILLAIWTILTASEGFIIGAPNSFFASLNVIIANSGTILYSFLTLFFVLGCIGAVSRGSGGV